VLPFSLGISQATGSNIIYLVEQRAGLIFSFQANSSRHDTYMVS
jgi:hypothetical protein